MEPRPQRRNTKPEFELILEFIGYKTIVILGILGSIYFFSGYKNYMQNMPFLKSFSPYYALHLHDGAQILDDIIESIGNWFEAQTEKAGSSLDSLKQKISNYFQANIAPFIRNHPAFSILLFTTVGFFTFISIFLLITLACKKTFGLLTTGYSSSFSGKSILEKNEDLWSFDPRRKPSEEQLKKVSKSLERLVQRAPAMGGNVPKNADSSIREFAHMNKESEYNYRWAVYVMGPIKGTNFDNSYEIPMALDQIKKVCQFMGQAAVYETLPLDLVLLRTKKGTKSWEVDHSTGAVNLGKSYPVKVLEKIMVQYRNYFIWDGRAKKSITGYGTRTSAATAN